MQKAWSTLDIKRVDSQQRVIEGIASTPSPDRNGDIMVPEGAEFALPVPFLWFHDSESPIGEVFAADVRPDGIYIKARISKVTTPGRLKTLTDEAWSAFTATPPLVRGLSIGWGPKDEEGAVEPIKGTSFIRFWKWIWAELSAVTIPMNAEATITAVKSADQAGVVARMRTLLASADSIAKPTIQEAIDILCQAGFGNPIHVDPSQHFDLGSLAATGRNSPGDTGKSTVVRGQKAAPPMTTQEQITAFTNTRGAKAARQNALMSEASKTGVTLDDAQTEEYDTLALEVKSIDAHLTRLRDLEQANIAGATAITTVATNSTAASDLRGGTSVIQVKANAPKGASFVRYAMAKAYGKGDTYRELEFAKQWKDSTPEVELMLKAASAPGTTLDATWAGPLAVMQPSTTEFLELLRPSTLIGKINNFRRVPFNVSVPSQTAGGTYTWVGQGSPKPVGTLQFATVTLGIAKAAGIIVISEELVKISNPSAEETVRQDMVAGMATYLDTQFIDPSLAAVANVSPGSVTNGTTPLTTAGTSPDNARTDLKALVSSFVTANLSTASAVFVMSEANAFALGSALNALGQPLFPGMGAIGGTILGIPVVTSQVAGTTVALIDARGILMADDGGLTIDVSREASVQMDSAPTDPPVAATVVVSLWQLNLVGLKAERWINWKRGRTASVKYVVATYV